MAKFIRSLCVESRVSQGQKGACSFSVSGWLRLGPCASVYQHWLFVFLENSLNSTCSSGLSMVVLFARLLC